MNIKTRLLLKILRPQEFRKTGGPEVQDVFLLSLSKIKMLRRELMNKIKYNFNRCPIDHDN